MHTDIDYLILGSGLSALTFGALMAKAGRKIVMLEAHEFPGGFGHTFIEKSKKYEYHFNAQLHYVWDCGEDDPVNLILKKLNLDEDVTFLNYGGETGFDHMRIPGFSLDIPSDYPLLRERLFKLFPKDIKAITQFIELIQRIASASRQLRKPVNRTYFKHIISNLKSFELLKYHKVSLQQVFDQFAIPKPLQTLLASQWLDFLLPPKRLSFYAFAILFDGYVRGAYYPKNHFENVINSLVKVITDNQGEIIYNQFVFEFIRKKKTMLGVKARDANHADKVNAYYGKNVICNIDPKLASSMIGLEHFSPKLRKQLSYDYSFSNFVVYGAVSGIDLRDYGFGNWNIFHSETIDLNSAFDEMYYHRDYKNIAFGMATPSLATTNTSGCPPDQQIFELLTVANYDLFEYLKLRDTKDYNKSKMDIFNRMLDIIERDYVPNFRDHIAFKMLGSPTTNRSYCLAPAGNSYGMNLTPENMVWNKLGFHTSLKHFYFCNASAGSPSFAKALTNGAILYEELTRDAVL